MCAERSRGLNESDSFPDLHGFRILEIVIYPGVPVMFAHK